MNAGDSNRNLRIYRKMIAEGKSLEPRSNIIMEGNYIIMGNMRRLFLYWSSFYFQRMDG